MLRLLLLLLLLLMINACVRACVCVCLCVCVCVCHCACRSKKSLYLPIAAPAGVADPGMNNAAVHALWNMHYPSQSKIFDRASIWKTLCLAKTESLTYQVQLYNMSLGQKQVRHCTVKNQIPALLKRRTILGTTPGSMYQPFFLLSSSLLPKCGHWGSKGDAFMGWPSLTSSHHMARVGQNDIYI